MSALTMFRAGPLNYKQISPDVLLYKQNAANLNLNQQQAPGVNEATTTTNYQHPERPTGARDAFASQATVCFFYTFFPLY